MPRLVYYQDMSPTLFAASARRVQERRFPWRRILGLLLPVGAVACNSAPTASRPVELLVRTDKAQYSLATDNGAAPVLVNLGPGSVFAPMNEYVYVERLAAGGWQDRHPWFAVDGVGISFRIGPGDSLAALPMNFAYVDHQPGTYRFVFEVALDSLGRRLAPEPQRVSPPFVLTP